MSDTAQREVGAFAGPPLGGDQNSAAALVRRALAFAGKQRELTVLVVVILLLVYFGLDTGLGTFFGNTNMITLTQFAAPIIIIALGEVPLLICGEIDLSPGFVYAFAPFLMYFLIIYHGFPPFLAMICALLFGVVVGWVNGFLTVTLGIPSFIATLGTGFVIYGLTLSSSNATQATPTSNSIGLGKWLGGNGSSFNYAEIIWAVILTVIFHIVLTRTKWGLHTIATGGNQLAAREAGIRVNRIKYGNFMVSGLLGAFVGLQIAYQTNIIDPNAGGYLPMFYSVAGAVIGGTALLGGSGTIIGAFLGSLMLAVLTDGFNVIGISAYPLNEIFGAAILIAMIANIQLARLRAAGRVR
jgi:simple sugar transport system permease protein